ncbi:MAG TPA: ABC transporter permease [Candidatus Eisenbacteria bacterium]|uniref:ABC transporter permease n=1 Tax=Eiseniibacteriota bacterium TaxID=2212470 RepID=A0A7V2F3B9_UNCEI|nr:ABC transporter permease [Candidatus Eisenbacteria bacterium]
MRSARRSARRFARRPSACAGLAILLVVVLGSIFAEYLTPYEPDEIDLEIALRPPSARHPFGTDAFGRDVLTRTLYGGRISLGVGFVARTISLLLGLLLGTIAGFFGGRTDSIVMRAADITFAFPTLLLLIAIMAVVTPGILSLFVALGVVGWAAMARLVRAQVLSVKEREYVQAARAAGAGAPALVLRHILPQCLAPILVVYTLGLGMTIMAESSLSFLGLGVQPPDPSWGAMISRGVAFMRRAPWLTLFPGLVLTLTICSVNLLGDGLRDLLDPASAKREGSPDG